MVDRADAPVGEPNGLKSHPAVKFAVPCVDSIDMSARQLVRSGNQTTPAVPRRGSGTAAAVWMAASWVSSALLVAFALFLLSGCTWTGKGKDVADALQKTAAVKTAIYSGSITMQTTGNAAGQSGAQNMEITFNGASDDSDPAAPRMSMDMTVIGTRVSVVAPGDGNVYYTTRGGSYGAPMDLTESRSTQNGFAGVMTSLESAIGNFREGAANSTNEGLTLRTIAADGDVGKICGTVVPAFSSYLSAASAGGDELKGLTSGSSLEDVCNKMLVKAPTLWFGIDGDGMLRMIALKASLSLMALGSLDMTMRFDLTSVNQPVKFNKPRNPQMLGSQDALVKAIGSGSGL